MADKKAQFKARLQNQISQLERHGNFAEVIIRTTPEATDMINFTRLWEHVLVQADRQSRGYIAKSSREDFEKTQADFNASLAFMSEKIKEAVERHNLDLTGSNFISRVAQRYAVSERMRKQPADAEKPAPAAAAKPKPEKAKETPKKPAAAKPAAVVEDEDL